MKAICTITFFLLSSAVAVAQLLAPHTLYRDYWNVINPASVSNNHIINEYNFTIGLSNRHQWIADGINFDVSPNTQLLNAEYVNTNNNIVLGGYLMRDRIGALSSTGAYFNFAYQIALDYRKSRRFSVGLSAGFLQDYSGISGSDQQYFLIPENDIIPMRAWRPDFNVGVFYYHSDIFYIGLSAPQLLGLTTQFSNSNMEGFAIKRPRHFYAIGGGYIPFDFFGLGDESSFLELSSWVRYTPFRAQNGSYTHHKFRIDGNIRYLHNQIFWAGVGIGAAFPPFEEESTATTFFPMIGHVEIGFLAGEGLDLMDSQLKIGMAIDFQMAGKLRQLGPSAELSLAYSWY
ncbi:MAG: PorP/SprF family type IX secretion system membrane protein [Bacteroidota bacterium]